MKNLKAALIQYNAIMPDIEQNTVTALKLIREAHKNGADIVLFPECFLTAYAAPDICRKLLPVQEIENHPDFIKWCENALTEDEEHFIQIAALAGELNIGVVITGFSKGKQYPQNTAWIIDRNGKVILKYSKVHTCDFDWERYLESGDSFPVCRFDGITMGCMICYDREYPESARINAQWCGAYYASQLLRRYAAQIKRTVRAGHGKYGRNSDGKSAGTGNGKFLRISSYGMDKRGSG